MNFHDLYASNKINKDSILFDTNDKNIYNEGIVPEFSFNMLPREIKHILTKLSIQTTKEEAWEYYANIEKWYTWEEDLKNITLKGNFETGSKGIMELEGMPPMEYELTHVKVFEEFWDKTATPFGNILFGHQIIDNNDGSVIIKHSVSLDSEDIQHLEFLKQVFSDVPDSIFILKKYLES